MLTLENIDLLVQKRFIQFVNVNLSYLVWVHNKHSLPVDLLHLIRCDQICHVNGFPAGLSLPQDRVQRGEQRSDVPLLPLDPIEDLTDEPSSSSSSPKHMHICSWGKKQSYLKFERVHAFRQLLLPHLSNSSGHLLVRFGAKPLC